MSVLVSGSFKHQYTDVFNYLQLNGHEDFQQQLNFGVMHCLSKHIYDHFCHFRDLHPKS